MKHRYTVIIEPQGGNTDVSIAHAMAELAAFTKLHPPPALPPKPKRGKRNSPDETLKEKNHASA